MAVIPRTLHPSVTLEHVINVYFIFLSFFVFFFLFSHDDNSEITAYEAMRRMEEGRGMGGGGGIDLKSLTIVGRQNKNTFNEIM